MIPSSRVEHFTLEVVQAVQSRRLVQWCTEATNGTDHYICFKFKYFFGIDCIRENNFVCLGLLIPVRSNEG